MRCQSCDRDNPLDASFCSRCGAKLHLGCPDCGRPCEPDSVFCGGCGHRLAGGDAGPARPPAELTPPHLAAKILRDRTTLEGERRTVTVLFIDAVSSVATGEKLEHEALHRMVRDCTERMVSAVHRFEGTVAQFRGDGIMALFGAPVAHEDTARRAISAALAMRESLDAYAFEMLTGGGRPFTYRIGLNTGPVVVGRIGDDLSMDYTAIGDTVNLAARMEQWAPPGKIYVTDATRRLSAGYFEFDDLGALEVKGKAEAVRTFEVTRELPWRTRLEIAADRGLTPYVGRAHELGALRAHLEQAQRGRGQVVFVSGEAGIGKSRLLLEFRRSLESEDVTWVGGQCISYGRAIPYLPVVDLLKQTFAVEEGDSDADVIRRVEERAAAWDEDTRRSAPYVRFLLNVDPGDERVATMDPAERRAGILDALRALLIRGASQRPVVMVFEDLHWVDEKSEEAIDALADVAASARVLLILTYRPGYTHSLGDRTHHSRLSLRHLAPDESGRLLDRVLQSASWPDEVRTLITAKAEGNPFYIEEVTKALIESGAVRRTNGIYTLTRPLDQLRIPETIQEVILTRIDRLDRDARDAMQLASVIGREFTVRLLGRISETHTRLDGLLGELKTLELIYEKAYFPELSYMFKHALTHEVAYSTLLLERRKTLHRIVGAAIEELYADRLAEQYETLAYHYELAEEWEKALAYLARAAEKAESACASHQGIDFYRRAIAICDRLGETAQARASEMALRQASIFIAIGDLPSAIESCSRAIELARRARDEQAEAAALAYSGLAQMYMHEFEDAEETLQQAIRLAGDAGGNAAAIAQTSLLCQYQILGQLDKSAPIFADSAAIERDLTDGTGRGVWAILGALDRNWRAQFNATLAITAHVSTRDQILALGIPVGEETGIYWTRALALAGAGDYTAALALLHQSLALSERAGEVLYRARTLNSIGWIHGELQDFPTAIEWNERSVQAALDIQAPDPEIECNCWLNMADCYIALGDLEKAEDLIAAVERVVRNPRPHDRWALWLYSQHMCASAADLWLARGDSDRALSYADECIERAVRDDRPKNEVKGRRARGRALIEEGNLPEAEREISRALEQALAIGNPPQIWKTYAALGELRQAQGRDDEAAVAYGDALAVVERVASSLDDDGLRSSLLDSALVSGYRQQAAVTH